MRPWHVLIIVIPILGFFGFRIMDLEDRVGLLHQMIEMQSRSAKPIADQPGDDQPGDDEPEEGYEPAVESDESEPQAEAPSEPPREMEELRARVEKLEARLQGSEASGQQASVEDQVVALATPRKKEKFEDYLRSVLRDEADRLRDQQLLKHRDAVVENRMNAVNEFAKRAGLSPDQESSIASILTDEADRMMEVLKQPEALEDPPRALEKWSDMLKETDEQAAEVLNSSQMLFYMQLRKLEQDVLMPWLPSESGI